MKPLPPISREIRLIRHVDGLPRARDFAIVEATLPRSSVTGVLVRNRYFRVSVSVRMMASAGARNIEGIPFPALNPGDALADAAIGEVVEAPTGSGLSCGDIVLHGLGWREYALVPANECRRLSPVLAEPAAYLGHGWTAYAALTRAARLRPGDAVFVSSGAGAIGSMAGQIARRLGAKHIIGSTGSETKAAWMKTELGYDAVLIRGTTPIADQLAEAAPDGIDVFVDTVGGEQLGAAVTAAREGARFALLGTLTAELAATGAGMVAPATLDSFRLIVKGVTLRGYSADSDPAAFDEWLQRLVDWRRSGSLSLPCSIFKGIENAPKALHEACAGRLKGVVLVEL